MLRKNRFGILSVHLTLLLVLAALFLRPLWAQHQADSAKGKLHGRYTAQQMVERAQTLCLDLVPKPEGLLFTYYPISTHEIRGAEVRIWQVDYRDTQGIYSGFFEWDADSGQLTEVSQVLPEDPRSSGRISSAQATEVSLRWLERMKMTSETQWKLRSAPAYLDGRWQCQFLSANASVLVLIRASDGQFLFARIMNL